MVNTFSSILNIGFRRLLALYFIPSLILIVGVSLIFSDFNFKHLEIVAKISFKETALYFSCITLIALMLGYLLDNLGSRWEYKYCVEKVKIKISKDCYGANGAVICLNPSLRPKDIYHFGWERFLSLSYDPKKKTGHRFLRYMVERLKFELNGGFVFYLIFLSGCIKSIYEICKAGKFCDFNMFDYKLAITMFISWVLARWLLTKEAPDSAYSLHETRLILVQKFDTNWKKCVKEYKNDCSTYNYRIDEEGITKSIEVISSNLGKIRSILFLLSLALLKHSVKVFSTIKSNEIVKSNSYKNKNANA